MEVLLDKAWALILTLAGTMFSGYWYLHKRVNNRVDEVAKDLAAYKEQQAKEAELHRIRQTSEISELKAKLEGVKVAIGYINANVSDINHSISQIAKILQERNK